MTFVSKEHILPGYPCGAYCYVCTCGVNSLENRLRKQGVPLDSDVSDMVDENFWDLVDKKKDNE